MAPTTGMLMLDYGVSYSRRQLAETFVKERTPRMMQTLVSGRRQLPGVFAAILYGFCSTSMAFMNKAILTSYKFDYPFTILVLQMVFTIAVLELLRRLGLVAYPAFCWSHSRSFLLPSMCYALNAVLGLYALGKMNIPMYGVLKRCTPVVSLVLAYFMLKKGLPSRAVVLAVLMMTIGCVIAGSGDLTFDVFAYTCGALSNVTQALYLTLVQRYSDKRSTIETLYLNSVNTLPFLLAMCFLKGEVWQIPFHPYILNASFLVFLLLVTALGCLLNYSMFLCTALNSALTTTVVGMFKTIAQTTIGFFAFGGVRVNAVLLIGVVMNLCGGILYAGAKFRDSRKITLSLPLSNKDVIKSSHEDLKSLYNGASPSSAITVSGAYYNHVNSSRERKQSETREDHDFELKRHGDHVKDMNER